jgi:hypothetical protein
VNRTQTIAALVVVTIFCLPTAVFGATISAKTSLTPVIPDFGKIEEHMEQGISEIELLVLILIRSGPLIGVGLVVQYLVLRVLRVTHSARGKFVVLALNALVAAAGTLLLCIVFPGLVRNALISDFLASLAFPPALLGVIIAVTIVTLWSLLRRNVTSS